MRPLGSPEQLAKRRRHAVALLQEGWMPVDVARKVGVDRRSVRRWRAAYDHRGVVGLAAKPVPGRPAKLPTAAKRRLTKYLLQGARAHGYDTDLWTCPRVAGLIHRKFGVHYHVDHPGSSPGLPTVAVAGLQPAKAGTPGAGTG